MISKKVLYGPQTEIEIKKMKQAQEEWDKLFIERFGAEFVKEYKKNLPVKDFLKVEPSSRMQVRRLRHLGANLEPRERQKKYAGAFGKMREFTPFEWRDSLPAGQKTWKPKVRPVKKEGNIVITDTTPKDNV